MKNSENMAVNGLKVLVRLKNYWSWSNRRSELERPEMVTNE